MTGDIQAIRLLFDRMDGKPHQRQIIYEEAERSTDRLADVIQEMLRQSHVDEVVSGDFS